MPARVAELYRGGVRAAARGLAILKVAGPGWRGANIAAAQAADQQDLINFPLLLTKMCGPVTRNWGKRVGEVCPAWGEREPQVRGVIVGRCVRHCGIG